MRKNFTFKLPDEPYKTTTALNKTVNAVYTGPRFLALCVIDATGEIKYIARRGETEADLNLSTLVDDDPATSFVKLDAGVNPFEAAYLTSQYETEEVQDPSFTYTDADGDEHTWSYHYDDFTGSIGQSFYSQDIKYVNGAYTAPRYREHATDRATVIASCLTIANTVENSLANNDYSAEDQAALEEYVLWLRDVDRKYAGIDHWKIPFPSNVPNYF